VRPLHQRLVMINYLKQFIKLDLNACKNKKDTRLKMRVKIYPILITSLGLLAGVTFYSLYHTAAPKKIITKNITTIEEPIDLQKLSPLKPQITSKKLTKLTLPTVEKEIQSKAEELAIETPEETQAIYDAITPDNYDETIEKADEAFATIEEYAKETQVAFLEEEANRNE